MNFLYEEVPTETTDYIQIDVSYFTSVNTFETSESIYLHDTSLLEELLIGLEKFKFQDETLNFTLASFKMNKPIDQVRSGFTFYYCTFNIENIYLHSNNKTYKITYYD